MLNREFHYRWEWQLQASPEALWPFVSDTNRFNRDTGVPAVEMRPTATGGETLTNARRRLRLYRFGVPVEWDEEPFEWVRPYRFGVVRHYLKGPVAQMRTLADVTSQPGGGSRLIYEVWARPRNVLGLIAIPIQIGVWSARAFDATFRRYDQLAAKTKPSFLELPSRVEFAPGGQARLAEMRAALMAQGAAPELVALLVELVETADDMALFRLRPYALADYWEKPRRAVLELCLYAVRVGLLNFQWDILCPLCRGAKQSAPSLRGLQSQVHCDSCHIDFTANFDRSVELIFRPNPAVRPTADSSFCVGGPQVTPHIITQQLLPRGAQRELALPLSQGRYRLRTLTLPGGQFVAADSEGGLTPAVTATEAGWPADELRVGLRPTFQLVNGTEQEQLFILERIAWSDQAATAAEVTALQVFRDLFANEALRPGERISVGSLTVLFTDLRDSTRLYRESGDAVAFGRVMNHFDLLKQAISAEEGAIVKTIGDAVMAVFRRPVNALRAVRRAHQLLAEAARGDNPLRLKAGIHAGPCVAVNLNDRLDYFGSTVNIASRLESLSGQRAGVVVSAAVRNDPEVVEWLTNGNAQAEWFAATLKGFEGEHFELWSVTLGMN